MNYYDSHGNPIQPGPPGMPPPYSPPHAGTPTRTSPSNKALAVVAVVVLVAASFAGGFFTGKSTAPDTPNCDRVIDLARNVQESYQDWWAAPVDSAQEANYFDSFEIYMDNLDDELDDCRRP